LRHPFCSRAHFALQLEKNRLAKVRSFKVFSFKHFRFRQFLVLDIPAAWLYGGMAAWLHDALRYCCMAASWRHGGMAAGCQYIGYDVVVQKNYDINIRHRSKTLQHRSFKTL
jgi:hypothetical protein